MNPNDENCSANRPDDHHRLTLGVLSITATVLLVGVLVVSFANRTAVAIGQIDRGGDYIMLTMQFFSSLENIVVTDAATQRIVVYGWDQNSRKLNAWTQFELKRLKDAIPGGPRDAGRPRTGGSKKN